MKQIFQTVTAGYQRVVLTLTLLFVHAQVFAGGVIPISSTDQTAAGTDFSTTASHILQKEILPFVELGGSSILLFVALNGLWKGYKEYQRERDMDPLKQSILSSVILIVTGGAILFLIDSLRSYHFA